MNRKLSVLCVTASFLLASMHCRKPPAEAPPPCYDFIEHLKTASVWPEPLDEPSAPKEALVFFEGFETPLSKGWEVKAWRGSASGQRTDSVSHEGSHAFALWDHPAEGQGLPRGADADVFTIIPVKGDTKYRFVGYVLTEDLVPLTARVYGTFYIVEFRNAEEIRGRFVNPPRFHREMPNHQGSTKVFRRIEYVFTTMHETRLLKIACSLGNWGQASGRAYFDNISLWEKPSAWMLSATDRPRAGEYSVRGETRRALAVRVPSTLEYETAVPEGAVLDLAIGVPQQESSAVFIPVVFQLTAAEDTEPVHTLLRRTVGAGEEWEEHAVSLSPLAGKRLTLRFDVRPAIEPSGPEENRRVPEAAFWAHPVLLGRSSFASGPSVLWISLDTVRADHMGYLGYPHETSPTLDRLASEGRTFSQAESASPWTLPSHATLLTGAFPAFHRADDRLGLGQGVATAAEVFSSSGYYCGAFTSHLYVSEVYGFHRGFQTFRYKQGGVASWVVDEALAWLRRHGERPTFLFLHFFDPHWDYSPPEPYRTMFDPDYSGPIKGGYFDSVVPFKKAGSAPSPRDLRHIISLYDGEIRYCDDEIGRLMQGLCDLGLDGRTLTVITSDHGEEFRDHGSMGHGTTLYEEQLHVPLIFHGAMLRPGGKPIETPVRTVDILPTLLELLELPADRLPPLGGVSLVPLLKRRGTTAIPPALAETRRWGAAKFSMRKGAEKIIQDRNTGWCALFDLEADPGERVNRSAQKAGRRGELEQEMNALVQALAAGADKAVAAPAKEIALTREQEEILRSLGYVQ